MEEYKRRVKVAHVVNKCIVIVFIFCICVATGYAVGYIIFADASTVEKAIACFVALSLSFSLTTLVKLLDASPLFPLCWWVDRARNKLTFDDFCSSIQEELDKAKAELAQALMPVLETSTEFLNELLEIEKDKDK